MTRESGNASVTLVAAAVVAMLTALALADFGIFLVARARVQAAADAAALAAASELVPGLGGNPSAEAARFAYLNDAALVTCECPVGAREAEVLVALPVDLPILGRLGVDAVRARARAAVDLTP